MARIPIIVVANYTTLPAGDIGPDELTELQNRIGGDAGMPVTVRPRVIDGCAGWVDKSTIAGRWPDCCGLVMVDADWNWRQCQQSPDHSPAQRFSGRASTMAGYPVAVVTIANKATWIEDAAVAMAAALKSANPATLVGPRPGIRPLLGRLVAHLVVVHRLVIFVLRLLHILPKDTTPPQEWGP